MPAHPAELYPGDIKSVLLSEEQIQSKTAELGAQIGADYQDAAARQDLLLITVLKGAVMFVTDLARTHGVWVLGGSFAERIPDDDRVYNTSFLARPDGEVAAVYRKIHLFDVDLGREGGGRFCESSTYRPGGEVVVADRKLPKTAQQALAEKYSLHPTDRVAFPLPFACPSLVQRVDGMNHGGTETSSPWADAVVQPAT